MILSTFRITESPDQYRFHDTYILLIERALCDSKAGFWEGPGGSSEEQDKTPRDALEREVQEETGLQLSRVIHALPIQTWTRSREGKQ